MDPIGEDPASIPHASESSPLSEGSAVGEGALSEGTIGEADFAEAIPDRAVDETLEPRFLILVHNDEVTPYEYVLNILGRVFLLSEELAEHIAWTAHSEGVAIVMVRPREEAKRLIIVAHSRARSDGYPLTFSMEPEP